MHNTRLGPRPAPPPVSGLGPARRRVLAALLRRGDGATIAELTQELGGHPNSIRLHLDALAGTGTGTGGGPLVEAAAEPAVGRGRPATRYRATAAAGALQADPAAEDYRGLVSAFAEHLAAGREDPRDAARGIGRGWGRSLAGDTVAVGAADPAADESSDDAARRAVIGLLGRLGFSPEAVDGGAGIHRLTACPLLDVARAHPEVVCQVHLGLVQGALEAHHPGTPGDVDLVPFAEEGACLLRIGPRSMSSLSG